MILTLIVTKKIFNTYIYRFLFYNLFLNLSFLARMSGFEQQQMSMATAFEGMLMNLFIQKMHRWKEMMIKKGNIYRV